MAIDQGRVNRSSMTFKLSTPTISRSQPLVGNAGCDAPHRGLLRVP